MGTDEEFHHKVTHKFPNYLRSIATNGNHLSMPHLFAPIVGIQCGVESAEVDYEKEASALWLEAWRACNPYPPAQAPSSVSHEHWDVDLLPQRPL